MPKKEQQPAVDFEQSLDELEKLVIQMESGELSLDESLNQFQRGVKLTRHCQQLLENARQTVEKLTDIEDDQSGIPFTDQE